MEDRFDLFKDKRTCYEFSEKKVSIDLLHKIYSLVKFGPTASNCCPLRMIFVESKEEKKKLLKCIYEGNVSKVESAPVTVIFGTDNRFFDKFSVLAPHNPDIAKQFAKDSKGSEIVAFRNATLQAGYFIAIASMYGLEYGPMSGFDNKKLDKLFFSGTSTTSNFLCNLGYTKKEPKYPRAPRLSFDEACKII